MFCFCSSYVGFSWRNVLAVSNQKLLHVVGRTVFLQLVFNSPNQLALLLEIKSTKNSWEYKLIRPHGIYENSNTGTIIQALLCSSGRTHTQQYVKKKKRAWLNNVNSSQVQTFSLISSCFFSSSSSFFCFLETGSPSTESTFLFLKKKRKHNSVSRHTNSQGDYISRLLHVLLLSLFFKIS